MSLKVAKTELAIQPYGASAGVRALNLDLSVDSDIELDPAAVIETIKETLGDDDLFENLLTGRLHLIFRSSDGDPVEQREGIVEFLSEGLSNAALDLQVKQMKLEPNQLRPPFIELHTAGTIFTGQDMFYENFNYVVCDTKNIATPAHPFALVEISKHSFSTFIFHITTKNDWDTIVKEFIEPQYVVDQRARIFLVPAEDTVQEMLSRARICAELATEHGVRVGMPLSIIDAS